jgi:hypothetical protein
MLTLRYDVIKTDISETHPHINREDVQFANIYAALGVTDCHQYHTTI